MDADFDRIRWEMELVLLIIDLFKSHIWILILTNSMQLSLSWEASSHSIN
jgi:hypothetical protein